MHGALSCGVGALSHYCVRNLRLPISFPTDLCGIDRTTATRIQLAVAAQRMDRRTRSLDLRRIRCAIPKFCREHRVLVAGARLEIQKLGDYLALAGARGDRPDRIPRAASWFPIHDYRTDRGISGGA